jgi:integrase
MHVEPGEAELLATRLVQLLENAAAHNTLKSEKSNWKHWLAFCMHRNLEPFRNDVRAMDHTQYDKEVLTLALALLFIYGRMVCRKGRKSPPRPASALAVLRGVRRAHARLGVQMADLSLATRLADSLNREYIEAHGWEALQVDRVAPLTNAIISGMLHANEASGDSVSATSVRAMWATLAQTGFRKAEVSLSAGEQFGTHCLTRHSLRWRIGGVEVADPTERQLRNLKEGDLAILIPPRSKCDQFGLEWGQAPIYLRFHPHATICAARALRDLELRLPRHGLQQREGTALFVNANGAPLTAVAVDKLFKACLSQAGVPRSSTAKYSPHSFRRYLACALRAQGASDSTIQALLRWKTTESLKLYSFLSDERYADLVDSAGSADVSSVRTNALPRAELLGAAANFHGARSQLQAAARTAEATPADEDDATADLSEGGDSDSDGAEATPPPDIAPPPPTRKRTRPAALRSAAPPAPAPPLTLANAVGRHALVPSHVWPSERCHEHAGAGWEVQIRQVDKRLGAVFINFVHARDNTGKRFASEWLSFEALRELQPQPAS